MRWITRLLSSLLNLLINGALFATLAAAGLYIWVAQELPNELDLSSPPLQQPLGVYTADGLLIGEFGTERRAPLPFSDTPPGRRVQRFPARRSRQRRPGPCPGP